MTFEPTPTFNIDLPQRLSDFDCLCDALDYAAQGQTGMNFYSAKGELETILPYADLRDKALERAKKLNSLGLEPFSRIGIIAQMDEDFLISFFACQYAGLYAVPLPVITGLGGKEGYQAQLRRILTKAETKAVIAPEIFSEHISIATQQIKLSFAGSSQDLDKLSSKELDEGSKLGPDDISHIQFSSGSTRIPLGILISQKALMANTASICKDGLKITQNDRGASWLPFYHDMGLIGFMITPITCQVSIDYMNTDSFARRPLEWLKLISKNKCTLSYSPSFGYEICVRRAQKQNLDIDLSHWRAAGIGGEMVQPQVMNKFYETFKSSGYKKEAFVASYGLAETTLAFSFANLDTGIQTDCVSKETLSDNHIASPVDKHDPEKTREFALCGKPLPGYELEIRDMNGSILPDRNVGFVYLKGPSHMAGYDDEKEATTNILSPDGWLNSGDMGYMIDGHLVITGRQKDLIIINGRNIWPQDLEWYVEQNIETLKPRDTAAFALPSGEGGKERAAILVHCRSQDPGIQQELKQKVHAAIFKNTGVDALVVLIQQGTLPYTTSGKLMRNRAKQNYLSGALPSIEKSAA